jgi:hypothetical protein
MEHGNTSENACVLWSSTISVQQSSNKGQRMPTTKQIVRELQTQRDHARRQAQQLDLAIRALQGLGHNTGTAGNAQPVRRMSMAARRKIAAFQKARWARIRAAKGK